MNDVSLMTSKLDTVNGCTDVRFCLEAVIEIHGVAKPVVGASSHGADIKSSFEDTDMKPVSPERSVGCQCNDIDDLTWKMASVMDTPTFRSYAATGRDSQPMKPPRYPAPTYTSRVACWPHVKFGSVGDTHVAALFV